MPTAEEIECLKIRASSAYTLWITFRTKRHEKAYEVARIALKEAIPMLYPVGSILENVVNGRSLGVVRVIEHMPSGDYRVADVRDVGTDRQLIARNKTYGAPESNLKPHESASCGVCYKTGLVTLG